MADAPMKPEMLEELRKKATPAHVAQYVTRNLPDEAQWRPFKHHLFLNDLLVEAATSTERTFLNVSITVRAGKSLLITLYLAFWYLGMYPDRDVLIVMNSADNAVKWGQQTRELMQEFGYELFGLKVDRANAGKSQWGIQGRKGTIRAVGIGSQIEGRGVHLGIIDDPIGLAEAMSPTEREKTWEWYTGAYRTRLMPGSTTVLVMSRWHMDDLAGKILHHQQENPGGDPWQTIKMPMIAEAPKWHPPMVPTEDWRDELGRRDGEELWPELWPMKDLDRLRNSMPSSTWESRYQQNPTPSEGRMFKADAWRFRPTAPDGLRKVRVWDLAATAGGGDWTVGTLMGRSGEDTFYVLDVQRFQKDSAGVKREILRCAKEDGRNVTIGVEQERAGAGKAQVQDLKRMLIGYNVVAMKPEGTKEQRAAPYASQQQDGNVTLVGPMEEWKDFLEEHRSFPVGRHDDQVDSASGAFLLLAEQGPTTLTSGEDFDELPIDALVRSAVGIDRHVFSIASG